MSFVEAGRKPRTGLKHVERIKHVNGTVVEAGRKPRTGLKHVVPDGRRSAVNVVEAGRKPRTGLKHCGAANPRAEALESRQGENPERD